MEQEYKYMVRVSCMTFNHAPYIVDALNGFTMQETNFPFVCTIVDDASTDGEQEVIKKYLEDHFDLQDKLIVRNEETEDYILTFARHNTNHNCFFAVLFLKYNHYCKKSKAPYIQEWINSAEFVALCEGDDYWIDSKKLQRQVDFLESNPEYGLVRTNVNRLYQDSQEIEKDIFAKKEWSKIKDTHEDYILHRWFAAPCTWLWRSDLKREEALYKRKDCFTGDLAMILAFSKQKKIKYLPDITSVYRVLRNSASHFENPVQEMNFWMSVKKTRLYFANKSALSVKIQLAFILLKEYAYRIKHSKKYSILLIRSYLNDIKELFF